MKSAFAGLLVICLLAFSTNSSAKPPHGESLPPGLQKKLERGEPLPPGWQKKLELGARLDEAAYTRGRVLPVGGGLEEVLIEDKVITVIKGTREIVDIFTRQ